MQLIRPDIAQDPFHFGRRTVQAPRPAAQRVGDDLKLFAVTFLAGFVFVSVLIA